MFYSHPRRGVSLAELLVALLLLEIAGVAALGAILTSQRINRRNAAAGRVDAARWLAYRQAEAAPSCADSAPARIVELTFPAEGGRPPLRTVLGCGQ